MTISGSKVSKIAKKHETSLMDVPLHKYLNKGLHRVSKFVF